MTRPSALAAPPLARLPSGPSRAVGGIGNSYPSFSLRDRRGPPVLQRDAEPPQPPAYPLARVLLRARQLRRDLHIREPVYDPQPERVALTVGQGSPRIGQHL